MKDINNLAAQFAKRDKEINEIFESLVEDTDAYDNNQEENLKKTIAMEFKMFRLRTIVCKEIVLIKQILNNNDNSIPSSLLSIFKKRDVYLASVNGKLTEMREDFNSIQKICYVNRMTYR